MRRLIGVSFAMLIALNSKVTLANVSPNLVLELPVGTIFSADRPPLVTGLAVGFATSGGNYLGGPTGDISGPMWRVTLRFDGLIAAKMPGGGSANRFMFGPSIEVLPFVLGRGWRPGESASGLFSSIWQLGFFVHVAAKFDPSGDPYNSAVTYAFDGGVVISWLNGYGRFLSNGVKVYPEYWWGVNLKLAGVTMGGKPSVAGFLLMAELPFFINF